MDLSLIQTHLDNFVDTWQGWYKVLNGLHDFVNNFADLSSGAESDNE